jgi:hypothetical protein
MSDKIQGGIRAGSTGVSLSVLLRKTADSTELTGQTYAGVTCSYVRQGGTVVNVPGQNLGSVTAAWTAGGFIEYDSVLQPGSYRMDWPDAAFQAGADWVQLTVKAGTSFAFTERIPLTSNSLQTGDSYARLGTPVNGSIVSDIAALKIDLDAGVTLTAPGLTAVTGAIFNATAASYNTAGSMGAKINSAASAADPLLNSVPGTYAVGTAGYVLGNAASAGAAATLAALQASTDWKRLMAQAEGCFSFTPPTSYPGTGTLVLRDKTNTVTLITVTLTFDANKVIIAKTTA